MVRVDVYIYQLQDSVVISDGKRRRYVRASKVNTDEEVGKFLQTYHDYEDGIVKYWYR